MTSRNTDLPSQSPTTIFEFEGCVWFNGERTEIGALEEEWPSVEIGSSDEGFCELWLGQVEAICAGASRRSRRVMLRFVMNELIKQAVEEFCATFESWRTDADMATTHELVRRLERWLTGISHNTT
jgi:hypothetical protein